MTGTMSDVTSFRNIRNQYNTDAVLIHADGQYHAYDSSALIIGEILDTIIHARFITDAPPYDNPYVSYVAIPDTDATGVDIMNTAIANGFSVAIHTTR